MRKKKDCGSRDHGDGEHGAKGHIGGSGVGESNHADRGGQQQQQPARGFLAAQAPGQPGKREGRQQGGKGRRETGGDFVDAKKFKADGGFPVVEDRFFKPRLAVETRGDPVAGFEDVTGDPGVARFVGPGKADAAKMAEVTEVEGGEYEERPENFTEIWEANVFGGRRQ